MHRYLKQVLSQLMAVFYHLQGLSSVACERALRGPLAVGWEKGGEVATMSLEFEYLHPKIQCEMLISRDDISNEIITLGMCFSMLVYSRAHFYFTLIGGNLTAQSKGSHRGIGSGIKNSRPTARAPRELACRLSHHSLFVLLKGYSQDLSKKQIQAMTVTLIFINYGNHSGEDTHYMSVDRPNDI